jgi:hypothetical protein
MMDPYTTRDLLIEAKTEIDRLKAELNGAYERAAQKVDAMYGNFNGWDYDNGAGAQGYDRAVGDAVEAIRNLKEPT